MPAVGLPRASQHSTSGIEGPYDLNDIRHTAGHGLAGTVPQTDTRLSFVEVVAPPLWRCPLEGDGYTVLGGTAMSLTGFTEALATAGPWAIIAVLLLVLIIVVGRIIALMVALKGTSEAARPDIIRALAEFFRDVFGSRR
ncbi:hypothetical protein ACFW6K_10045 [Streptomyces sp. NPDC058733]|uniref:hypothetical protein n=1 Tax=Streptomyces sp. NPDC058733 TaxID=3346614 RepID=UPI0036BE27BF